MLLSLISALAFSAWAASSSAVAVSPDGKLIAAVNPDGGSVTVVRAADLKVLREVRVGIEPRALCFTPDGKTLAVANHGSSDVSLVDARRLLETKRMPVGTGPAGIVAGGGRLYVSEQDADAVAAIDLSSPAVSARVPVEDSPAGLALSADGRRLLVTHFFTGRLSALDAKTLAVEKVLDFGPDADLSQFAALSPDGRRAYLPQTLSNSRTRWRSFDRLVVPVVNVADLDSLSPLPRARLFLGSIRRGANRPAAAAVSPDGRRLYVANAGSSDVTVLELPRGRVLEHVDVGAEPRGLALSPDGRKLYVDNVLDGTLSVVHLAPDGRTPLTDVSFHRPVAFGRGYLNPDAPNAVSLRGALTCASCHAEAGRNAPDRVKVDEEGRLSLVDRPWRVERTVALTRLELPPVVLRGKRLFHSALSPDATESRWVSCASCHPDGRMDRRTWKSMPEGERNTPALLGAGETAPLHWSGTFASLLDVQDTVHQVQFGRGLSDEDLAALAAYVGSLRPAAPLETPESRLGSAVFAARGCAACHPAPLFTDLKAHGFDTPSLRGARYTAPYFHDGSARALEDVLRAPGVHDVAAQLSEEERRTLTAYLRSL